jgi:AAA+ ATPase superfamily predicted ATPase
MALRVFLAGRRVERAELQDALTSTRSELIAVHGRRRVGKTYLIRAVFAEQLCFELTGMRDASLKVQLANFTRVIAGLVSYPLATPSSWVEAFELLERFLTGELAKDGRKVVFLDELPWLASPRSGFLSALDHFWNSFGSRQRNLILVICGSAASWMIVNVLHHKGGLHNRVTRTIALKPFNLQETEAFLHGRGVTLDRHQILELFMAVGGIPYYLDYVRNGRSAAQNIDAMFFSHNAPLRDEFNQLYAALFEHHERHVKVIHALAKKRAGLTRQDLRASTGLPTGGRLTTTLSELETTGFILRTVPFGKTVRDSVYRLIDAFTLFYLRWVSSRGAAHDGASWWLHRRSTPPGVAWSGYAFENVCLSHVIQIKQALGISGILTEHSSWQHRPSVRTDTGAQIDLIIDRPDRVVNLCEMKYSDAPFVIDKKYAKTLRERSEIFRRVTGTHKSLFVTFVTVHGVSAGAHASELVANEVRADALFAS